jgi:RNA polymerase sigma-70 factor (ECF subfamily)
MKLTLIDESIAPCPYTVKELNINLQKAIYDLPDHLRSTFELSRLEGKKYTEIAEIQHISVKTVEYRISQALKILKTRLSEYLTL